MQLRGSCHCQAVRFSLRSVHPCPYNLCYCECCRKTAGTGGYAINLGGDHASLEVEGEDHTQVYRAEFTDPETGETKQKSAHRYFCKTCGTALWAWDPRWPELVHPFASAIDTELPGPPERTHLMLQFKAPWVEAQAKPCDSSFEGYPEESISAWHARLGLARPD